jgi:hypothetical protein
VNSARARRVRVSSRHSLSPFSHSRPPTGTDQSVHRSSGFADAGCAAMLKPPSLAMSSTTSRGSPASGYGASGKPSPSTCPPSVLISTASIISTPLR